MSDELFRELIDEVKGLRAEIARNAKGAASTTADDDRLWNAKEVARYLGCSEATVYEWSEDGSIPNQRVGRCLRFDPATIRAWAKNPPAPGKVVPLTRKPRG